MAGIWTNNWRAFRNIMVMGSHYNGFSTITNENGVTVENYYDPNLSATTPLGNYNNDDLYSNAMNFIKLGTGNTAPTATDYNVTRPTGLSYLSCTMSAPVYDDNTATVTRSIAVAVQNTGSESVTIREWGLFGAVRTLVYGSGIIARALLYREVLTTPVTLTQYQAATLTLTVSLTLSDPVS